MADPANMTDDFMAQLDTVIDAAYVLVNRIEIYIFILIYVLL